MAVKILKLSELPYGETIEIGGHLCAFTGYEKRKTQYGAQEHFIFKCDDPKHEKIFERYKFAGTKIKLKDGKYKW